MSSQRKINSARTNGAKSHGPKTKAGLEKSSRNALTHGLYSATIVLASEPREQYQTVLDAYLQQFQPDGPVESHPIEEIGAAKWRQRRLWAIETDLLEDEIIVQKKKLDADGELTTKSPRSASPIAIYQRHPRCRYSRATNPASSALISAPSKPPRTPAPPKTCAHRPSTKYRGTNPIPDTNAARPEAERPQVPPSFDLPACARGQDAPALAFPDAGV
jgi:hypothetical protein